MVRVPDYIKARQRSLEQVTTARNMFGSDNVEVLGRDTMYPCHFFVKSQEGQEVVRFYVNLDDQKIDTLPRTYDSAKKLARKYESKDGRGSWNVKRNGRREELIEKIKLPKHDIPNWSTAV